jgi:hypothetical protein
VRSQQNAFFTAGPGEHLLAVIVAVVMGVLLGIGGSLLLLIPFTASGWVSSAARPPGAWPAT